MYLEVYSLITLSVKKGIPIPAQVLVLKTLETGYCGSESREVDVLHLDYSCDQQFLADLVSKELWDEAVSHAEQYGYYPHSEDGDEDEDELEGVTDGISGGAKLATIADIESCYGWPDDKKEWLALLDSNNEWLKLLFPASGWPFEDNITPYYIEHPKHRIQLRIRQVESKLSGERQKLQSLEKQVKDTKRAIEKLTDELTELMTA